MQKFIYFASDDAEELMNDINAWLSNASIEIVSTDLTTKRDTLYYLIIYKEK